MKALQNLSPVVRLFVEGLGAMAVLTVVEAESNFTTEVPKEVHEKLLAITSHQSSLIAEHFHLEDIIYSLHRDNLKPFLDPNVSYNRPSQQPTKKEAPVARRAKREKLPPAVGLDACLEEMEQSSCTKII